MGMFAGMNKAEKFGQGVYFKDGTHLVEIVKLLGKSSEKKNGKHFFIAECRVLESTIEPEGTLRSWTVNVNSESGLGDVKAFLAAIAGSEDSEIFGDDAEAIGEVVVGADNPCAGMKVALETFTKPQKADPTKTFTHHRWSPIDDSNQATMIGLASKAPPKPARKPAPPGFKWQGDHLIQE